MSFPNRTGRADVAASKIAVEELSYPVVHQLIQSTGPRKDLVLGCATLAVAAAYYAGAARIPDTTLADAVGPAGLPKGYALLLAGLSAILIARSVVQAARSRRASLARLASRTQQGSRHDSAHPRHDSVLRAARLLLIGAAYVVIVPWLGYAVSIAGLLMAVSHEGGLFNRRVVATAVIGAISFWLLFVMLLGIPQPSGMWTGLF